MMEPKFRTVLPDFAPYSHCCIDGHLLVCTSYTDFKGGKPADDCRPSRNLHPSFLYVLYKKYSTQQILPKQSGNLGTN